MVVQFDELLLVHIAGYFLYFSFKVRLISTRVNNTVYQYLSESIFFA